MKKVVQFITDICDGGAETLVKDYALLLDKKEFEVVLLTRYPIAETANSKHLRNSGIRIVSLNKSGSKPAKIWNKLTFKFRMPVLMKKFLNEEKPDVIHAHLAQLCYLNTVADELKGIKLFYTCHNIVSHYFSGKNEKERIAAENLIKNNDLRMIALHDDMKNELNVMFKVDNSVVIRNGIDFSRFRNITVTKEEKRKEIGIPENAFVMGHIGRFAEQKNHPFLVDVFNEVAKARDDAFLLMVGAGDTASVIEKLNNYGLNGRYMILSNRTDIPELLKAMDVFVFPSLFEGLGIVLIEAQVAGLKCVVSDNIPSEAFRTGLISSLSLKESAEKWRDEILCGAVNTDIVSDIDNYDINKEIRRLESLYNGII